METLFFILECDFLKWTSEVLFRSYRSKKNLVKNPIPYNYTQFFIIFAEDILRSAIWKQAFIALAYGIFELRYGK